MVLLVLQHSTHPNPFPPYTLVFLAAFSMFFLSQRPFLQLSLTAWSASDWGGFQTMITGDGIAKLQHWWRLSWLIDLDVGGRSDKDERVRVWAADGAAWA